MAAGGAGRAARYERVTGLLAYYAVADLAAEGAPFNLPPQQLAAGAAGNAELHRRVALFRRFVTRG